MNIYFGYPKLLFWTSEILIYLISEIIILDIQKKIISDIRNYAEQAFHLRYPNFWILKITISDIKNKRLFWISKIIILDIRNSYIFDIQNSFLDIRNSCVIIVDIQNTFLDITNS